MSKPFSNTRRAGATASDDALHKAAREAVKAAIEADHAPDPLFRPEVSRLVSAYTSAAKRHGPLIERAIGDALEAAGCTVFRNLGLPVTQGALELAESHEYALTPKRQIRFVEGKIASFVDVDVLAIDEEREIAWALAIKRGGGATETKKRRAIERDLMALRLNLASYLRQQGYSKIETAHAFVVDYLGSAGFSKEITLTREKIDSTLGLPITASIDAMTQAMKAALDAALARMLAPVIRSMETPAVSKRPETSIRPTPFGLHAHSRRRRFEGVPRKSSMTRGPFDNLSSDDARESER
jgi:hypothetical protein